MEMKKIFLFLTLIVAGITAAAQNVNVQSAAMDLRKGYISKAKEEIDKACVNPETKDNAKTWYYAALVYRKIGEESEKPNSKYKDLDRDWIKKTLTAAKRCIELDNEREYTKQMSETVDLFEKKLSQAPTSTKPTTNNTTEIYKNGYETYKNKYGNPVELSEINFRLGNYDYGKGIYVDAKIDGLKKDDIDFVTVQFEVLTNSEDITLNDIIWDYALMGWQLKERDGYVLFEHEPRFAISNDRVSAVTAVEVSRCEIYLKDASTLWFITESEPCSFSLGKIEKVKKNAFYSPSAAAERRKEREAKKQKELERQERAKQMESVEDEYEREWERSRQYRIRQEKEREATAKAAGALMPRYNKLNEEGRKLAAELNEYRRKGQVGPWLIQNAHRQLQIADEKVSIARKIGDRQLIQTAESQKAQVKAALKAMNLL